MKTIVVDDEKSARETICLLLKEFVPDVEVVATAADIPAAVVEINRHQPQLVFLDVEMPEYDGFQIVNFFREIPFEIIFVTAYSHHAIRAFEISAVDYLLKPVGIELLRAAVQKTSTVIQRKDMHKRLELLQANATFEQPNRIALPVADGLLFVEIADIMLLEAEGAYCQVILRNGSAMLVSKKLRFFEEVLENRPQFYRCHRSYLVNINFLRKYHRSEGTLLLEHGKTATVAREKKTEFEQFLRDMKVTIGH